MYSTLFTIQKLQTRVASVVQWKHCISEIRRIFDVQNEVMKHPLHVFAILDHRWTLWTALKSDVTDFVVYLGGVNVIFCLIVFLELSSNFGISIGKYTFIRRKKVSRFHFWQLFIPIYHPYAFLDRFSQRKL